MDRAAPDMNPHSSEQPSASLSDRLLVRPTRPEDHPFILGLLRELELDYPARDLARFLVGEADGKILAIAELKEFRDFFLLSCVGVREDLQGTGLGKVFMNQVLRDVRKDVYLYTLVPGFFMKTGFVEAMHLPVGLPPRLIYGCTNCDPASCRCLVRKPNAP
jgi:N-acetylglutamate synthase-like GNAT family acetyltransferase